MHASVARGLRLTAPDGIRTNGVVAEVPQFLLMNSREDVKKMWQHVATCGNMWQDVATCGNTCKLKSKMWQSVGNLWPFCENPVCPDPVWKSVNGFRGLEVPHGHRHSEVCEVLGRFRRHCFVCLLFVLRFVCFMEHLFAVACFMIFFRYLCYRSR